MRNFCPVMAFGILSIAASHESESLLSGAIFVVAVGAFIVLAAADLGALAGDPGVLRIRAGDTGLALDLFTWVAACSVLAEGLRAAPAKYVLGTLGLAAWLIATTLFAYVLLLRRRDWLANKVDGSWLLAVVGAQSMAVLGASAAEKLNSAPILAASLGLLVLGLATYSALIALIVRRLLRHQVGSDTLTPDYWITMGALAISTVAATSLLHATADLDMLASVRGVLTTVSIIAWVGGSAWIPYLWLLELNRVRLRGASIGYDARRWSTVFPLAMYSVATYEVAQTIGVPGLILVAHAAFWAGLALGLLNAAGLTRSLVSSVRGNMC